MDPGDISYKIIKSERGYDSLVVSLNGREVPLHSRVHPEREAGVFINKFEPDKFDVLIVLGVGLGYHLAPLVGSINRYSNIMLIDILPGIDAALENNPLTSFLSKSARVSFLLGKSEAQVAGALAEIMDFDRIRGISVLEHPASMRIFQDYYGGIKKVIEGMINRAAGNKATQKAFGGLYLGNSIKNIARLDRLRPVHELFGGFSGYPAVIIASGPCLERDLGIIKKRQAGIFIIAVDSALSVLSGSGISPDFVVSIDPQPYVLEHFLGCDAGGTIGVLSLSSCPPVLERVKGYVSLTSHPLSQFVSRAYDIPIGSVDSGTGSVAGDAVNFCLKCGFSAVGLIGFDFCFSDYKIYSRGTAYQKRYSVYFQNRFSTVEGYNCRYILHSSGRLRKDGKFTRKSFLQYRRSLEDFIRAGGVASLYAVNECGLGISGATAVSLEEFMGREGLSGIDKKKIIRSVRQRPRSLAAAPVMAALKSIIHEDLFDEILAASLGGSADQKTKDRYRRLIAAL